MSQLASMLTLVGALAAGVLLGRIQGVRRQSGSRAFVAFRNAILVVLVFTMGFRIGRTDEVIGNIMALGLTALAFSSATVAGTLAVLALVFAMVRRGQPSGHERRRHIPADSSRLRALRDPLVLLSVLAAGFIVGLFVPLVPEADGSWIITAILYLLLAVIGIGLSASGVDLREIVRHPDLFILPAGTAAGSLLGGLAVGLLMGIRPGTSLALASGFGWYSLSGVILTRLDGPMTGSIAFLSNMLREVMSLVLIPLLARTRFPHLAIGSGGATSMDVTLIITYQSLGEWSIPYCLVSGGILSLMVPILTPLMYVIGK